MSPLIFLLAFSHLLKVLWVFFLIFLLFTISLMSIKSNNTASALEAEK